MTNWKYARRDLRKQLGVGLACVPLLRAEKAHAAAGKGNLMVLQMSEGLRQGPWRPAAGPLTAKLPPTCEPFEPHKSSMIFLPNLSNPGIGAGGHGSYGVIYYGLGAAGGGQYVQPKGKTFDQVIADGLPPPASGRASIHMHVQLFNGRVSTTAPGGSRCFWKGAGQPITPLGDPYALYGEIFAGGATATPGMPADDATVGKLMNKRKSILDYVGKSLESFKMRVGTEDRVAINAHFQSIRDLENQLQSSKTVAAGCGGNRGNMIDLMDGSKYPDILKANTMLMVDALKCGVTNVVTLQTGDSSGNNINFAFVPGIPAMSKNNYKTPFRNWHDLGHSPVMDGVDHKQIVDKWFMTQWAALLQLMKDAPTGDGSLLDNTLVVIGNHMQEGQNHNAQANPWMLAGNVNKYFNTGQSLPSDGKPVSSVMAAITEAFGIQGSPYTGPMPGLKKA